MATPASSNGRLVSMDVFVDFKVLPLFSCTALHAGCVTETAIYGRRQGPSVRYRSQR
jgi:hypothetical protein